MRFILDLDDGVTLVSVLELPPLQLQLRPSFPIGKLHPK
jgi:hypothetical protein